MRFLTLFFLSTLCLFAANAVPSEKDTLTSSLFTANDATVSNGSCSYACRATVSGYITQIIDIDAKSGTTYCEVYSVNDTSKPLGVNANQTNTTCKKQANKNSSDYAGQLKSNSDTNYKLAGATYDTGAVTFSRFLAGMCTLDPDIIDFGATKSTGILQVKDPNMLYGTNISTTKQETLLSYFGAAEATTTTEIVASADSLNKANLGYFANLFLNISNINQYLQNLTFALVCAWFIVVIAFKRLSAYLEKKELEKGYLKKLYIPIVAVAFFYMPIVPQESNMMSSSLIQIIVRNFMATSTKIADKAAVAGANTYLQKLYASVGANTMQGEATIYALRDSAKAQAAFYANVLQECKSRFPQAMTFQVSDADLEQQSIYNINQVQEGITAKGCRAVERKWFIATKTYNQQTKYADQIAKSFSNGALQSKLNGINSFLNNRQTELGWVNAALMPSAAILIELMPMIQAAQSGVTEDQKNNQEKIRNSYASADESKSIFEKIESEGQNLFGAVLAKLTYMIVPGANTMFEIFNSVIKGSIELIGLFAPGGGKLFSFLNTSGLVSTVGGVFLTSIFIELILKYIPLVTSMLAGILAIIGWIIEVIKYFYVAPYVVSFSVTLRKTDKISEFLVTGIVIFFKPVLLVIFIYLGLFLYYLCVDVFVMFAKEQFYLLDSINESFYVALILHVTLALIEIISTTASVYFMWKVILSGPSYVIRLLGLNNTNDFIEPISQKLEKYSFT